MAREATTLNTWAIAVARTLDARGVDSAALFRQAGMDPAILQDPNGRYAVSRMRQLWRLAVDASQDPCLGIHAAEYVQPATFHSLGLAILASQTLEDALTRGARFSRIVSNAVDVFLEDTPAGLREIISFREDIPQVDEAIDLFLASTLKMGRILTGREIQPLQVRMRRPRTPEIAAEFARFIKTPIEFSAPENAFMLSHELARQPLPMANPALARQNDQVVMEYLSRYDGARISEKVHRRRRGAAAQRENPAAPAEGRTHQLPGHPRGNAP
jgi:hypothetical protein